MNRSILLSIMFIAGTLGVIAFSAAQFTDFETSATNPLNAGTLDLGVSGAGSITCTLPADGLEGRARDAAGTPVTYGVDGTPTPTGPNVEPTNTLETQAYCPFTLTHTGSLEHADVYAKIGITPVGCTPTPPTPTAEFCDATPDLQATQFIVVASDVGTPSVPVAGAATPVELSTYLSSCTLLNGEMPIGGTPVPGWLQVELEQNRTSNVMQGDSIVIQIDFELAEDGTSPTTIDCVADTSNVITP